MNTNLLVSTAAYRLNRAPRGPYQHLHEPGLKGYRQATHIVVDGDGVEIARIPAYTGLPLVEQNDIAEFLAGAWRDLSTTTALLAAFQQAGVFGAEGGIAEALRIALRFVPASCTCLPVLDSLTNHEEHTDQCATVLREHLLNTQAAWDSLIGNERKATR